jgi:hypothetical protein
VDYVKYKGIVLEPFNYAKQNGYLKLLIEQFLGKKGRERGASSRSIYLVK